MSLVTCDLAVTLDGYAAGPNQSADRPFGEIDSSQLHGWMFDEPDQHAAEIDAIVDAGAFVMGRNMFGPGRGAWDLSWKGWWGDEPPYHAPVFVLTHHARDPLVMAGGTTFTFVTDGMDSALAQARVAAGDRDVAIAGGATTVNKFLAAGMIDELRLHVVPFTAGLDPHGTAVRVFDGAGPLRLEMLGSRATDTVTHNRYRVIR